MHSNATICSITSLRSLFSKMCVFGEDDLKLLSRTLYCANTIIPTYNIEVPTQCNSRIDYDGLLMVVHLVGDDTTSQHS